MPSRITFVQGHQADVRETASNISRMLKVAHANKHGHIVVTNSVTDKPLVIALAAFHEAQEL